MHTPSNKVLPKCVYSIAYMVTLTIVFIAFNMNIVCWTKLGRM